jgi:phenylalanyl-tRNA synthetase beta chain
MSAPFTDRKSEEGTFGSWLAATGASAEPLVLSHPLDENRRNLRATLLPGLLDAAARNLHHGEQTVGLFEVGRVFDREGAADDPPSFESRRAGFALAGEWRTHWSVPGAARRADFSDAKGVMERLLEPWADASTLAWKPFVCEAFTPGAAASVETAGGKVLGVVGLVAASERERRKTSEEIFVGEIMVEAIPARVSRRRFVAFSAYPPIEADLSFAHARTKPWSQIEAFVRGRGLAHLEDVRVVDRYEGAAVADGQVKTTIRLTFRCADRTLEQDEVNREVAKLAEELGRRT